MSARSRLVSLVARKAVQYLRSAKRSVDSVTLANEVLATTSPDEETARRILVTAFAGDPRLSYVDGHWEVQESPSNTEPEPDRALVLLQGGREVRGEPFRLDRLLVVRMEDDVVITACGGEVTWSGADDRIRESVLEALDCAVLVVHDEPGSIESLERWLDLPVDSMISLRRIGHFRYGLPATHDLDDLAGELGISWVSNDDPLEMADVLDNCLESIRKPGESLDDLMAASFPEIPPLDWSRFDFDREFLRSLPATPGTYRFFDVADRLLYVGKSNNLQRRVGSYFRDGNRGNPRIGSIIENLHRIEVEPSGSELEAILREAEQISRDKPGRNVQRRIHSKDHVGNRLRSILIIEPAAAPLVLLAYLIREGRLIDRVGIGPRGGGLKRIERVLQDHFFSCSDGPTEVIDGPDLDVEMIARWLTSHRDRVVAFDPTNLRTPEEVTDRLRWFLAQGSPFDPDGKPILTR